MAGAHISNAAEPMKMRNPTQSGHPFRSKPATLVSPAEALDVGDRIADEASFAAMQGEVRCPPRERRCGRFEKF
jgi:hypothetical protein